MRIDVLDHGYVELVETWGSEESIIAAARMSTNKGFQGWGQVVCHVCRTCTNISGDICTDCGCATSGMVAKHGDEKLLYYLYKNHHETPFEMAGLIVEVQAPIFVIREWVRHRTQSFNEMSARYTPLPDVNYVPSIERLMMGNGATNKQAQGSKEMTSGMAQACRVTIQGLYKKAQDDYDMLLVDGAPKELARLVLPVGRYSRMRASANLRNWLAFLKLRMAPNSQWEIVQYANAVGQVVADHFPRTWSLFQEDRVQ